MITVPSLLIMLGIIPRLLLLLLFPGAHKVLNEFFASLVNAKAPERKKPLRQVGRALLYQSMWAALSMVTIAIVGWIVILILFWEYLVSFVAIITIATLARGMFQQKTPIIS